MSFRIVPTIANALMMKGPYGQAISYGVNALSAHQIDKHVGQPDTLVENGLQLLSPAHYIAYKVAKQEGAGIGGYALATLMPQRYAAYHLSKKSGGKVSFLEMAGILFAPTATVALNAAKDEVKNAFGKGTQANDHGDTFTTTSSSNSKQSLLNSLGLNPNEPNFLTASAN